MDSIYPYARMFLVFSNFLRIPVAIVSYYKPGLCKYHLYFLVLHRIVKETLPIDYGDVHLRYMVLMNSMLFVFHSFDYLRTMISLIVLNLYSMVFVRSVIY